MTKLGINIDHVATLRNARGEGHPNIQEIAKIVKKSRTLLGWVQWVPLNLSLTYEKEFPDINQFLRKNNKRKSMLLEF